MLDPKLLSDFLSRPRKIAEIAAHFGISQGEVEAQVSKAIESGEVLLSSPRKTISSLSSLEDLRLAGRSISGKRSSPSSSQLPSARVHTVHSNLGAHSDNFSAFKTEKVGPLAVKRNQRTVLVSNVTNRKRLSRESNSLSPVQRLHVYESLMNGPQTSTALHTVAGVPRKSLKGMVRNDLIRSSWGPKTVGVLFEITKRGHDDFETIKAASRIGVSLAKRNLIPARTMKAL